MREAIDIQNLIKVKKKNKILMADSATLMGILDPFGVLEED